MTEDREVYGLQNQVREVCYYGAYYEQLIGATVVGITFDIESDEEYGDSLFYEVWPTIVFEKDGERFSCEISKDEEGNGPGWMFGLRGVELNPDWVNKISKEKDPVVLKKALSKLLNEFSPKE